MPLPARLGRSGSGRLTGCAGRLAGLVDDRIPRTLAGVDARDRDGARVDATRFDRLISTDRTPLTGGLQLIDTPATAPTSIRALSGDGAPRSGASSAGQGLTPGMFDDLCATWMDAVVWAFSWPGWPVRRVGSRIESVVCDPSDHDAVDALATRVRGERAS
jgi:hypothetical protein